MIKIVNGDLLKAKETIIAHQVNCKGKMGSGVALQIKNKYPEAYRYYKKFIEFTGGIENPEILLGAMFPVSISKTREVVHLFGQLDYGYGKQQTNLKSLKSALKELKTHAKLYDYTVALPYKIGSDRGGADWSEVYAIIEEVFHDYEVTLYKI